MIKNCQLKLHFKFDKFFWFEVFKLSKLNCYCAKACWSSIRILTICLLFVSYYISSEINIKTFWNFATWVFQYDDDDDWKLNGFQFPLGVWIFLSICSFKFNYLKSSIIWIWRETIILNWKQSSVRIIQHISVICNMEKPHGYSSRSDSTRKAVAK